MVEDFGFWIMIVVIFFWWFFFNLYLVRAGKRIGINIWGIWLILPIFYVFAYLELAKKSYWHLLWLWIPYIGFWGLGHLWLTYNICKSFGVSRWWCLFWPVAPLFWDIEKIGNHEYYTWICEYCGMEFNKKNVAEKHEKVCNQNKK